MRMERRRHYRRQIGQALLLAVVVQGVAAAPACAFVVNNRWTTTASGSPGAVGRPATITWSIAPDGTPIPERDASSLVSFLDTTFGAGEGGDDLTARPWFGYFEDACGRWNQLSGINFIYEPHDDGSSLSSSNSGVLDVRGDVRLSGAYVDGASNTLAYTYYPNYGDMVIDTADGNIFSQASADYRRLRNVLMHEFGHAIGLDHVVSNDVAFLMEPYLTTAFYGPQLDDICGVHSYYGDVFEKSNNGLGNALPALATDLGAIVAGATVSIGVDAAPDLVVGTTDVDFLSITNDQDQDFFSFTVSEPLELAAALTPLGGVFHQAPVGGTQTLYDANAQNDLSLTIFASDGTSVLATADSAGLGEAELLSDISLPAAGEYFALVRGTSDNVQLYQLDLSVSGALLTGDFNGDGTVDAADYTVWRDSYGQTGTGLAADADGDGLVDDADFTLWKQNYGTTAASGSAFDVAAVPEPTSLMLAMLGMLIAGGRMARRRGAAS